MQRGRLGRTHIRSSVSSLPLLFLASSWLAVSPPILREAGPSAIHAPLSTRGRRCLKRLQVCNRYLNISLPPEVPIFASSDMGGRRPGTPSHVLTPPSLIGSGAASPRHNAGKRGASKRKQTLLSLLDALNELTNDDEAFPKGESPAHILCSYTD